MGDQQQNLRIISEYESGISANKLSKKYNKNISSIMYLLRKNNVIIRSISENVNKHFNSLNKNREFLKLSIELNEFFIGLLCGDGCLRMNYQAKYPNYIHTDKNKEYIDWLINILESQGIKCSKVWINKISGCYTFQTERLKAFEKLYKIFYNNTTKKQIYNIKLTPLILKNWYIGDGHAKKSIDSKNLSTVITSKFYCKNIEKQLKNIFGEECKYHHSSKYYYIPVKYRNNFLDYIGECEVDCYQYKFIRN